MQYNTIYYRCLDFMTLSKDSVLRSTDFNSLSFDALCAFLLLEQMAVVDELRLYRSAVTWAKSQKGNQRKQISDEEIRNVLQKALFLIRLPTVDAKGFSDVCGVANILTGDEKLEIYHYILSTKPGLKHNGAHALVAGFSGKARVQLQYTVERFFQTNSPWNYRYMYDSLLDALSFKINNPICLTGVGIYGTQDGTHFTSVKLDIIDNTGKNLNTITARYIPCTGRDTPVPIRWGTGVDLRQDTEYTVSALIKSNATYKGDGGKSQVTVGNTTFTFTPTPNSKSGTNVNYGQIPQLLFCKLPA